MHGRRLTPDLEGGRGDELMVMGNRFELLLLAPQGALVVVVFLDISNPIQSNPTFRFECSQLFYVKLWGQVKPS